MPFIEPISSELSVRPMGNTLATGFPRFSTTIPSAPSSSKIWRHYALNSLTLIVFTFLLMMFKADLTSLTISNVLWPRNLTILIWHAHAFQQVCKTRVAAKRDERDFHSHFEQR
jgi:hypothetical protein